MDFPVEFERGLAEGRGKGGEMLFEHFGTSDPDTANEQITAMRDELAAIRKIVDGAVTSCGLGAAIAEHFGRKDLP